jgi:photosystem II stability/assembly factor-like uncharacterized protein
MYTINKHLILITVFVLSITLFPQESWFWQNPLPQGNTLLDVKMLDANTVAAVGGVATFMKSSNFGDTWTITHKINDVTSAFNSLFFLDASTGWATVGGDIYKTTNAGSSWDMYSTGFFSSFEDIFFIDGNNGWTVGATGNV